MFINKQQYNYKTSISGENQLLKVGAIHCAHKKLLQQIRSIYNKPLNPETTFFARYRSQKDFPLGAATHRPMGR